MRQRAGDASCAAYLIDGGTVPFQFRKPLPCDAGYAAERLRWTAPGGTDSVSSSQLLSRHHLGAPLTLRAAVSYGTLHSAWPGGNCSERRQGGRRRRVILIRENCPVETSSSPRHMMMRGDDADGAEEDEDIYSGRDPPRWMINIDDGLLRPGHTGNTCAVLLSSTVVCCVQWTSRVAKGWNALIQSADTGHLSRIATTNSCWQSAAAAPDGPWMCRFAQYGARRVEHRGQARP